MTEAEKAYQYFVIAVPESEEQAKAYFWARKARLAWNTRAPILSAEEMEMQEGME